MSAPAPVGLRLRPDLVLVPIASRWSQWWVVKDPVALRYHQVLPMEYVLLTLLDGSRSLEDVRQEFERRCAPHRLTNSRLQQFLSSLYHQGLLLVDSEDQGVHLLRRRNETRRQEWWQTVSNPLAIRFRGLDPQRWLDGMLPWFGWIFGPVGLLLGSLLVAFAAALVFSRLDAFLAALPTTAALMSPANLVFTGAALALVKVLHEFGHGLTCRRLGAECHELGVMLLVGVPCLYCNVSDAWTLRSRWQRAAVSLAGIWVELLLASIAALVWMNTYPSYVQTLSLNVMIVCSVSTVLFNGNPLLRYDGYYALSDLTGVPNLGPRSSRVVFEELLRGWWGIDENSEPNLSITSRLGLLTYGIASMVYRLFVTVAILWTLRATLRPWNLEGMVWLVASVVVAGMVVSSGQALVKTVRRETSMGNGSTSRGTLVGLAVLLVLLSLLRLPWPHYVRGPAVLEPAQAASVYAVVEGELEMVLPAGQTVKAGDVIGRLRNDELRRELVELEGKHERQRVWVETLESRRSEDPTAAAQLPAARSTLADLGQQVEQKRADASRLTIRAPRAGVIFPPPRRGRTASPANGEPEGWSGDPLSDENRHAWMETGTLLCQVGDAGRMEAVTYVAQSDVEFVAAGQSVDVLLDGRDEVLNGKVLAIAPLDLDELSGDQVLPERLTVVASPDGTRRLSEPGYQVRVELPQLTGAPLRTRARARVAVGSWSVGALLMRELYRTFRFRL